MHIIKTIKDIDLDLENKKEIIFLFGSSSNDWTKSIFKSLEESKFDGIVIAPDYSTFDTTSDDYFNQIIEDQLSASYSDIIIFNFNELSENDSYVFDFWKNSGKVLLVSNNEELLLTATNSNIPNFKNVDDLIPELLNLINEIAVRWITTEDQFPINTGLLKINDNEPGFFVSPDDLKGVAHALKDYLNDSNNQIAKKRLLKLLETIS